MKLIKYKCYSTYSYFSCIEIEIRILIELVTRILEQYSNRYEFLKFESIQIIVEEGKSIYLNPAANAPKVVRDPAHVLAPMAYLAWLV
jgi:hypothetical protein